MSGSDRSPTPAGAEEMVESAFRHIENPRKRGFLRAYALCGKKGEAARASGLHVDSLYNSGWRFDPEFQEALELAREMYGDVLEAAMIERGVHGVERVRFDKKSGLPSRDPRWCERCGGAREDHPLTPEGEPGPSPQRDCEGFLPRIYTEREHSDRLLERLAESHAPNRYSRRVDIRSVVAKVDFTKLPDVAVARIAAGEDPQAVLASIIADGGEDAEKVRLALPEQTGGTHRKPPRPGELVQEERDEPTFPGGDGGHVRPEEL
ncbi:MAG: hypothetical protein WD960_11720 [Gemmatimonadota bacterium]